MRYIRYAFWAVVAALLIAVSLANREIVTLDLLPNDLADLVGVNRTIDLPLFVVIFGGIAAGLLIGFVWEWLREHRQRAEAAAQRREMDRMRREIKRLQGAKDKNKDEVIAILDQAS